MRIPLSMACVVLLSLPRPAPAQATPPAEDAAVLYLHAAKVVADNYGNGIQSPAASNMTYPPYPPFSKEWLDTEEAALAANAEARALAHQARSLDHANWPSDKAENPVMYLNNCRGLANDLGDAALYQHSQGDDAAAMESIRDAVHFADLLDNQSGKMLIRMLVSVGIRALTMDRLEVITSGTALTKDPINSKGVQVAVARELVGQLLKHEDAETQVKGVLHAEGPENAMKKSDADRLIETVKRVNMERDLAAMSLACHLYRFDTKNWPKSLEDLHGYLPNVPIDPFGDGKQMFGYVLIKAGLPDGTDRPLVYSRCRSKDGLFILNDQPHYSFYGGSNQLPQDEQKQGGQFRDVASWTPVPGHPPAATTQPLN